MTTESAVTDENRLLFGAGFVFGVAFTMLLLAVVTSTVASRVGESLLASEVVVTIAAGIFFAAIVGTCLFFLAFPENRVRIPVRGFDAVPEEASADDGPDGE